MKLPFSGKGIRLPEFRPGRRHLRALLTLMLPALGALLMASGVQAEDLLAKGQATVTDTFGASSSVAKWIILAEIIVGIISYIKTRNIFVLFGIAVVIVFTTIGFGLVA